MENWERILMYGLVVGSIILGLSNTKDIGSFNKKFKAIDEFNYTVLEFNKEIGRMLGN